MRPTTPFLLPDVEVVALAGRDAAAFAQAQFMNDVTPLADGQWQWSGWLTPKGRVIAVFALLRLQADDWRLALLDHPAAAFAAALKRYVFRSKVAISAPALVCTGCFGVPPWAVGQPRGVKAEAGVITLALSSREAPRTLQIGPATAPEDAQAVAAWRSDDLRQGVPRLHAGQRERWTPQQLSLDRLHAYSVKKGCYPGQEIVARTHFLGQAKRGLGVFEGADRAPAAIHAPLTHDGEPAGEVIAQTDGLLQAVITLPTGPEADRDWRWGERALRRLPLAEAG